MDEPSTDRGIANSVLFGVAVAPNACFHWVKLGIKFGSTLIVALIGGLLP